MNDTAGSGQLTVRLIPWPLLLIAAVFLALLGFAWYEGSLRGGAWLLLVVPVVVGLFFEVASVTVDPAAREVKIRRARVWGAVARSVPFEEVVAIALESSTSGRSRTYGVALALRSGERVPLRGLTSSGAASKRRLAQRLAEAIDLGRETPVQRALDGAVRTSIAGSTDGMEWTLDHVDRGGGWQLTRFSTPAARLADAFVFIAPSPANGGPPPLGGVVGVLARGFLRQHLVGLELREADLPHLDRAVAVEDGLLSRAGLAASASAPDEARRWLDAGAAALVAEWRERPATAGRGGLYPHLLLGPDGLRLLFRASLRGDEDAGRIRELGLGLARLVSR